MTKGLMPVHSAPLAEGRILADSAVAGRGGLFTWHELPYGNELHTLAGASTISVDYIRRVMTWIPAW